MAVRSITGSSGEGSSSMVQNPDRTDFTGNTQNTSLMSASSRLDLDVDQDRNDETRNVENFYDGDFPAIKPNYDRRAHTHHRIFSHNAELLKKHTVASANNTSLLCRLTATHATAKEFLTYSQTFHHIISSP